MVSPASEAEFNLMEEEGFDSTAMELDVDGKQKTMLLELQTRLHEKPEKTSQVFFVSKSRPTTCDVLKKFTKNVEKTMEKDYKFGGFIANLQRKIYSERSCNECLPSLLKSSKREEKILDCSTNVHLNSTKEVFVLPRLTHSSDSKKQVDVFSPPRIKFKSATLQLRSTSGQPDISIVLTHLHTNLYDVTEPENDNFFEILIEKRKQLSLITDLPDLIPGFRKKLVELFDEIDPSVDRQLVKGLNADQADGQYFYALPRNRNDLRRHRSNPYDLQIVSANEARMQTLYYLGSSTSVIKVEKSLIDVETYERQRALDWMWERKLFYLIYDFKVFQQFRLRKAFILWRRNVRLLKNDICRVRLYKLLFTTNDFLRGCMLHVRTLCEYASSSHDGVGTIIFVNLDKTLTLTMSEFVECQKKQCKIAEDQLKDLKTRVIDIVMETCRTVSAREGINERLVGKKSTQVSPLFTCHSSESLERKSRHVIMRSSKRSHLRYDDILHPMQLPNAAAIAAKVLTHTEAIEFRQIFLRLSQFIRYIDYLMIEMIHRLVKKAMNDFSRFVTASCQAERRTNEIILKEISKENELNELSPESIVRIQIKLILPTSEKQKKSNERMKKNEKLVQFKSEMEEVGRKLNDEETNVDDDDDDDDDDVDDNDDDDDTTSCQDDRRSSLILSPTEMEIRNGFKEIEVFFQRAASTVTSLLAEPCLSIFSIQPQIMEADKEQEKEEMRGRDVEMLLNTDPHYCRIRDELMNCVENVLHDVIEFSLNYMKCTSIVDSCLKSSSDESLKRRPIATVEQFQYMLALHTDHYQQIKSMTETYRFGFIYFSAKEFLAECLEFPLKVLNSIKIKLPEVAIQSNSELVDVIQKTWKRLDKISTTVEEFVDHMTFLGKMTNELPFLEKEFNFIVKLFTIANDFEMTIKPEDFALYQILSPSFQQLKTTVLYAEAKLDDNIIKFSKSLEKLVLEMEKKVVEIKNKVMDPVFLNHDTMSVFALQKINDLLEVVSKMIIKARNFSSYQDRFGSSLTKTRKQFSNSSSKFLLRQDQQHSNPIRKIEVDLMESECHLMLRRLLWESIQEWDIFSSESIQSTFESLHVDDLQKQVNRFTQTVFVLEKGLPHNSLVPQLKNKVMNLKQMMPCIVSLRNPSLKQRHWIKIESLLEKSISNNTKLTLGDLQNDNVNRHKRFLQEISTTATSEAALEYMLEKISDLWERTDFRLVPHSSGSVFIIASADELFTQLEESQVTIATIRGSRYVSPIKTSVEDWERKLQLFSKTLDVWLLCQRNWLNLEKIFSISDIQRQMPSESNLFIEADVIFKELMRRTVEHSNAVRAATMMGVFETISAVNSKLEKIQKSMEDYLEMKRLVFPRFYFLSNEEMLELLMQSKNPDAVQSHLGKCFISIKTLDIQLLPRQPPTVRMMTSPEGEVVALPKSLRARGSVEQWLVNLETAVFDTVKKNLKIALSEWNESNLKSWLLCHSGQIVLTATQVMFNRNVSSCFDSSALENLKRLKSKVIQSLDLYAELMSTDLIFHKRLAMNALLTISVHNRDTVDSLIRNSVIKQDDFEWTRQLRYEWDEQNCHVLQFNAKFVYGYEYLGCSSRLVMTPLTDRCYLTLTSALAIHLGGSPAGPAGTGKTETVKDLARAMGKQCFVFNCSEGLDLKTLGRFFSGLSQSGCWSCFDEFNRIDLEVLSVVAQQLHTIKTAKDQNQTRFIFEGRDVKLNSSCGIFITMNPSYAGRVDLPDNLKSFFRPVAMMVPDYALICEIILFSEGFNSSVQSLSAKVVDLYRLADKQLSKQNHYDFGLRAMKSVLMMAGQKKRQMQLSDGGLTCHENETRILIQALLNTNLPKFISEDVVLFRSLMLDLFPGTDLHRSSSSKVLTQSIVLALEDQGLQNWPSQVNQVRHFYNQLLVRHAVMLVGPTCGGKTVIRNILQRALVLMPTINLDENDKKTEEEVYYYFNDCKRGQMDNITINPKCLTVGELYGQLDSNTLEWSDGVLANAARRFSKLSLTPSSQFDDLRNEKSPSKKESIVLTETEKKVRNKIETSDAVPTDWQWLTLDGPVDSLWVENLNTALDDSKVLCLPNGERITINTNMRFIFEVDDLSTASPATISRCAMVYVDPAELGWQPQLKTWLDKQDVVREVGRNYLKLMFDHSIDRGLKFVQRFKHLQTLAMPPQLNIISCLCNILSAYFDFMKDNGGFGFGAEEAKERQTLSDSVRLSNDGSLRSDTPKKGFLFNRLNNNTRQNEFFLEKNPGLLTVLLGKLFVFAFVWAFGGSFNRHDDDDDDDRLQRMTSLNASDNRDFASEFDAFLRDLFEVEPPCGVSLPSLTRNMFSYFVDLTSGHFVVWDNLIPSMKSLIEQRTLMMIDKDVQTSKKQLMKIGREFELVPTIDTVRYSFLSALLLLRKNPVLLTGETGCGKTFLIKQLLQRLEKDGGGRDGSASKSNSPLGCVLNYSENNCSFLEKVGLFANYGDDEDNDVDFDGDTTRSKESFGILSSMIHFSFYTSTIRSEAAITSRLIRKTRDRFGAPKDKQVIVFIDDMNMPKRENYGAQPALELLRQFLDLGGFFDTKKCTWKSVHDVTLISACGQMNTSRNSISPRLLKHFCMLALPQPSTHSLQHIYQVHLGKFLSDGDFLPEVRDCLMPLITSVIGVYRRLCMNLRPTPAKLHYLFNFGDLSKVISGMFQASKNVMMTRLNVVELLTHEMMRVFHDRLIDDTDSVIFCQLLSDVLYENFKIRLNADELMSNPILFADFFDTSTKESQLYKKISDLKILEKVLDEFYLRMNSENPEISKMVFFRSAAEHVLRAARVFKQPLGHMMLVGLDGTGKTATVQLAAYIAQCQLIQLNMTKVYSINDFREDIKKIYMMCGLQGISSIFLLPDKYIIKESFLEDINSILSSGEVVDLFNSEEIDAILMELKSTSDAEDLADNGSSSLYQFFIQRVKKNLHIVLTMSQAGTKLRNQCRQYPSLINRCTIDWFRDWNAGAMLSVAKIYFKDFASDEKSDNSSMELIEGINCKMADVCVEIHGSVSIATKQFWDELKRYNYLTAASYVEFIRVYATMLEKKKTNLMNSRDRLLSGLSCLLEANSMVGIMQVELVELGPKIQEKAKDTEVLLEELVKDQEAVEQVQEIVKTEEKTMKEEMDVVHKYAHECQQDLASVIPMLQSAVESLNSLDKADIVEIRVYTNPPHLVRMVLFCVCLLLQEKSEDNWNDVRLVMSDQLFLKRLILLDRNSVPEKVFTKLKKYTGHPDFTPDKVGTVSKACRSMCLWVLAVEHYHNVYKMATPKQKRLEVAREALQLAKQNLHQKEKSLAKIEGHLKVLQKHYQDSLNQQESLKERKDLTTKRLQMAAILIKSLSLEKDRWTESAKQLELKINDIFGDMLISAAVVVYSGIFTTKYRQNLISDWMKLCDDHSLSFERNFIKTLVTDSQILRWRNEGLPSDNHSLENAVIVHWSRKWPLLIDPQGQASKWIQEMEGTELKVVQTTSSNYLQIIEDGIRNGKPVLLQDVTETLDPALDKVFLQETFIRGLSKIIKIDGVDREYNDNFRLYATTTLVNPHFLPSVSNHLTIVNFNVTFIGLEEQLLSILLQKERPKLEVERNRLLSSLATDLQTLSDLEDKTLAFFQKSEGHILDQTDLIEMLEKSKNKSEEIKERVKESEKEEMQLNLTRQRYLTVATRGSVIYFVLVDLSVVNVMYQFSLAWFQEIFSSCLHLKRRCTDDDEEKQDDEVKVLSEDDEMKIIDDFHLNMKTMIDRITLTIFRFVSIGLFAKHRQMFAFALYTSILRSNIDHPSSAVDGITEMEWLTFLQGSILATTMNDDAVWSKRSTHWQQQKQQQQQQQQQQSSWMNDMIWNQCHHLETTIKNFCDLCHSMISCKRQWQKMIDSEDPYHFISNPFTEQVAPSSSSSSSLFVFPWQRLTNFQRLILIKILCPSALTLSVYHFIRENIGEEFISFAPHPNQLREIFEKSSTAKSPIIFILSPGSDPLSQVLNLAKEMRGSTIHLDVISLGRGQGQKAAEIINKSQILKGRWIFLQNCHLAASWMPKLHLIVNNFTKTGVELDPHFRLWLSSKPDQCFPISVLQNGVKITVEPPQGIKSKLLWSFSDVGGVSKILYDRSMTDECRVLLFGLCLFNSVLHERKKYNKLGWNVDYDFNNNSDLQVSILHLQKISEDSLDNDMSWPALWYLTGEVVYGGRVTDKWDRRCLQCLLKKFYNSNSLLKGHSYSSDKIYSSVSGDLSYSQVRHYIEELPDYENPDLLGMDRNANRAALESEGKELLVLLLSIQPRINKTIETVCSGKSNDDLVLEMTTEIKRTVPRFIECHDYEGKVSSAAAVHLNVNEIHSMSTDDDDQSEALIQLRKLENEKKEKGIDISEAIKRVQQLSRSPIFNVLRQEVYRFDFLLKIISRSAEELTSAINGEIVMSRDLEDIYDAFINHCVPFEWKQHSYKSCKSLGAWIKDLIKRTEFFKLWSIRLLSFAENEFESQLKRSSIENAHPIKYWFPAFFFPQGFLTAVLQNHARKVGISVNRLRFKFEIFSKEDRKAVDSIKKLCFQGREYPEDGVIVWGFYLDGASWNFSNGILCNLIPGQRYSSLPEIHLIPTFADETDSDLYSTKKICIGDGESRAAVRWKYECPVYQTSLRVESTLSVNCWTNYVTTLLLDTDKDPDLWVLRGLALVCQLDE